MKNPNIPAMASVTVLLTAVGFYFLHPGFQQWVNGAYEVFSTGDIEQIKDFLESYRHLGYLILLGLFIFQMFLFFVPSVLVMSLCILMYGPFIGSLLCLGGVFTASVFAFVLGDAFGDYTVDKIIGKSARKKMNEFLDRYGFWTVFVFRLSPFLSNDAVSFVSGLANMRFIKFISATMLGIMPLTVLLAWMGRNTQSLRSGFIIVGIISLSALAFYIYIDRRRKRDDGSKYSK